MNRILLFIGLLILLLAANTGLAQNAVPEAAMQAISNAIQRGDLQGARDIYDSAKRGTMAQETAAPVPQSAEPQKPSLFETTLPGGLKQFGYDIFNRTAASFTPPATMPVGPDYIIGPGDQFTLTLWGTTEGIYNLTVSKEGVVTLPKVGVVNVSGTRFGDLERTVKRHLSKYYSNFNLSVAMGGLKTVTVYVVGEVIRPGSYSVSSLTTVYGALFAAGGPTKLGTLRNVQVLRSGKVVRTIDLYDFLLKGDRSQDARLQNEDTVFVPLIGPVAGVSGMVYRPAIYELKGAETLGGLLGMAGGMLPVGLGSRLQMNRFANNERQEILDILLKQPAPGAAGDVPELKAGVMNMDLVTVFPIYDKVWETVTVSGEVKNPGTYQWRQGLRVGEVLAQASLLPTADVQRAEIVRVSEDLIDRKVIPVDLAGLLAGDASKGPELLPKDHVRVFTVFRPAEKVTVSGEVGYPGQYEIGKGDRLSDLFKRVKGFTAEAYPYGMIFKRRDVKNAQAANLRNFITRMQRQVLQAATTDVATAISKDESGIAASEMSMNQSLLANLKAMQEQFEGRVALTISADIASWAGTKDDLLLQDGDTVHIPKKPQEVMVMGEVHSPGALVHVADMTVAEYVGQTGGLTDYADEDQVYVMQANGFAYSEDSPSVGDIENVKLQAGDTVFVPQKIERYAAMRNTRDIVDIMFKTAVIIATITILF